MTDNEKLKADFSIAAAGAKTAQDISNALTELERADGLKIADYIFTFCKQKSIDPQAPELAAYFRESTEYKEKIQADEERRRNDSALKALTEKIEVYKNNLERGVFISRPEMLELVTEINKEAAILGARGELSRLGSFKDYIDECINYDPDRDYSPSLFDRLSFPNGTISYIGARTGRGKTTAMVNLAREALTSKEPRKTIFISLEMSRKQILNKLILSMAYAMTAANNEKRELLKSRPRPQTDLYHYLKQKEMEGSREEVETFREYVKKAIEHIQNIYNKNFYLYDGRGAGFNDIINAIKGNADPGTLVLLDYIQRMPTVPGKNDDTYMRVKYISDEIVKAAIVSNSVIISGAQFNRMKGDKVGGADVFDDASYRESGDIEQDAHNAIGIGWLEDKKTRFFEVMKTREDAGAGRAFYIDFVGAYSYMAKGEIVPKKEAGQKKGKEKQAAGDKSGAENDNGKNKPNHVDWD